MKNDSTVTNVAHSNVKDFVLHPRDHIEQCNVPTPLPALQHSHENREQNLVAGSEEPLGREEEFPSDNGHHDKFEMFKHMIEIREIEMGSDNGFVDDIRSHSKWHIVSASPEYDNLSTRCMHYDYSRLRDKLEDSVWDDEEIELRLDTKSERLRVKVQYVGSTPVLMDSRQLEQVKKIDYIMLKNNNLEREDFAVPDIYNTGESASLFLESLDRFVAVDIAPC